MIADLADDLAALIAAREGATKGPWTTTYGGQQWWIAGVDR